MGNAPSNNSNSGRRPSNLFRSNSQQAVDPGVIHAALERAAQSNPDIYQKKLRSSAAAAAAPVAAGGLSKQRQRRLSEVLREPGVDGVAYFEEYEGNEPHDEYCEQGPLEPEMPRQRSQRRLSRSSRRGGSTQNMGMDTSSGSQQGSMSSSSRRRRRGSVEDFAKSVSHMSPQQVLRSLEGFADMDDDDADEYLHTLKNQQ